jgi:hypothetical protein
MSPVGLDDEQDVARPDFRILGHPKRDAAALHHAENQALSRPADFAQSSRFSSLLDHVLHQPVFLAAHQVRQ